MFSLPVRALFSKPRAPKGGRAEDGILVVRTDSLGDLLLATPLFKHLKRSYVGHRIILVTRKEWLNVIESCPYVDEFIPWSRNKYIKNIFYRLRFIHALRKRYFKLALNPLYSREPLGHEMMCCCRAANKIGYERNLSSLYLWQATGQDRYYTRLIQQTRSDMVEIDRNRHFAEQITGRRIEGEDFQPEVWLRESDRTAARKLLNELRFNSAGDRIIACFPGAAWKGRAWAPANFASLIDRLSETYGAKILLCGAAPEEPLSHEIAERTKTRPAVIAGKTTLRQLAAVFEHCSLFIGNETGPLHLAAALGIPTLCIMGGGHFGRFYPYGDLNKHRVVFKQMECYGCDWHCVHKTVLCITELTVDDVWLETQRLMQGILPINAATEPQCTQPV